MFLKITNFYIDRPLDQWHSFFFLASLFRNSKYASHNIFENVSMYICMYYFVCLFLFGFTSQWEYKIIQVELLLNA